MEIRTLSAELDSVWTCHLASKSPLPSPPTHDQVIVSHNQEIAQPGPRPINFSIDKEFSQSDPSDSAALQREPHNIELSPEAVPPPPPSNDASCRRPHSPPDPMNIQHLLQKNASYDILSDTRDVQSSAYDSTNLPSSLPTTSQAQLEANASLQTPSCGRDPPFSTNTASDHSHNRDVNEEKLDTGSHVSDGQELRLHDHAYDQHSSHGNNSLDRHLPSESDERRKEETEIGDKEEEQEDEDGEEAEGDEQPIEGEEDGQKDENDVNDDAELNQRRQMNKSMLKVVDDRSKRFKTRVSTFMTDIGFFKCLEYIPQSSI